MTMTQKYTDPILEIQYYYDLKSFYVRLKILKRRNYFVKVKTRERQRGEKLQNTLAENIPDGNIPVSK